jgi:hypothetical protein
VKPDNDPFIDNSIRKDWNGEPVEYDGKPLKVYEKPTFEKPHGCVVEEITIEEFLEARWAAARAREEAAPKPLESKPA